METMDTGTSSSSQTALKHHKEAIIRSFENEKSDAQSAMLDKDLVNKLDSYSLESIVELKIARFLDQVGSYHPEDLYDMIIKKAEKPLLNQILKRTAGNQVQASKILGINRNTLRKKMKIYNLL
ncbi:MAG: hypothetical protein KA436_05550 [Oligoflexales bacterium]|nr:hypothetical protein [Oligoflexales bacterium]